ncbi:HD domain-containing protein [Pullulanibacillus sp. KACC 23026]|uniref:HD domain-containing phosphohydrolase n=1 Tax=Pullulanibacillus sp. KACC 23026 TaxID=3028315 RepID=UPI0023AED6F2|nr:HD domain-containing phosphohydrolase [Pullulanibacillus sp. KACC 23026]WEG12946.1 HD domain-containing protein [Pullulanibacillus sp. KACC 23026]
MEGFTYGRKGSFLDQVKYDFNEIRLLSRGGNVEVLTQTIEKDKLFYVYPSESDHVFEFYFIVSGKVLCELDDEKIELNAQDYFSSKGIKAPVYFKALTEVTLLWVITEPTFIHMSEDISSFMELVKQVEKKDPYTELHSDRVANYAVKVARKMRLNPKQVDNLILASYLHDIGKMNVPEEILNKPSSLTLEEFDLIKKHPREGAQMLKGTYDNLVPIIDQHHERLNGTGYPDGLKGDAICLEARIIAVCDTFDAMTEDRAYRKAFSAQYAMNELKRLSGIHYDAAVVDAFELVLKEEGKI